MVKSPEPGLRFELENGISISADAFGDPSKQLVLFLHGGGQTRHAWGGAAETLAGLGFYAVCTDHRGHGDSSWNSEGGYTLDVFANDLLLLLQHFDDKPIIVGASLGGVSALRAEALSEEPVTKALVLLDGFGSREEAADAIAAYRPHRKRRTDYQGLAKNLRLGDDGRYRWHWDPEMIRSWDPEDWTDTHAVREEVQGRIDAAKELELPVLLIRGGLSDVVSEDNAREFLDAVPHAEYVDLKDAAHMVAGDRNDAFTESVAEFILRHFPPEGENADDR